MLDLANANRIFTEHGIRYAILDDRMEVVAASGDFPSADRVKSDSTGKTIFDLAPELVGSESELEAILAGELTRVHVPMINRETEQGQLAYWNFTLLPHLDAHETINGLLFVAADITAMAKIEQAVTQHRNELSLLRDRLSKQNLQMAATNAELRRVDELKSKFVSIAAHELRSPLSTVAGYLDLLADEDFGVLSGQQQDFVAAIQRSADRLLETIEKLLDLTRIASGRMDIILSLCEPEELVEAALDEVRPLAEAKNQQLVLTMDNSLPRILCDKNRITQALHNLLSNAVKYSSENGRIQLAIVHAETPGFVQIAVIDDGIGIPENDHSNIFESFFRASNVHQARATGSGLGLNITRSLIELHGGEIWFESQADAGTRFYATLPTADGTTQP